MLIEIFLWFSLIVMIVILGVLLLIIIGSFIGLILEILEEWKHK